MRRRSDRAMIQMEWIQRVVEHPAKEVVQADGRICGITVEHARERADIPRFSYEQVTA